MDTTTTTPATTNQPSHNEMPPSSLPTSPRISLLTLPREIREQIYEKVYHGLRWQTRRNQGSSNALSLLATSHRLWCEAATVPFKLGTFHLKGPAQLEDIVEKCSQGQLSTIRQVAFHPSWQNEGCEFDTVRDLLDAMPALRTMDLYVKEWATAVKLRANQEGAKGPEIRYHSRAEWME